MLSTAVSQFDPFARIIATGRSFERAIYIQGTQEFNLLVSEILNPGSVPILQGKILPASLVGSKAPEQCRADFRPDLNGFTSTEVIDTFNNFSFNLSDALRGISPSTLVHPFGDPILVAIGAKIRVGMSCLLPGGYYHPKLRAAAHLDDVAFDEFVRELIGEEAGSSFSPRPHAGSSIYYLTRRPREISDDFRSAFARVGGIRDAWTQYDTHPQTAEPAIVECFARDVVACYEYSRERYSHLDLWR